MMRAIITWLLLTTPLWASQDSWPALYDVTGVATDDVLNVRSEPGTAGDVIGALKPDAVNVEVIRDNDGLGTWGLVNVNEGSGWVSLAFMARQPGQIGWPMPEIRQCFGTEPFWSLTRNGAQMSFEAPDMARREGLISGVFRSRSRVDRFVYSGSLLPADDGIVDVVLNLRTEACSDGMSDRDYGISLDLFLSGSSRPGINGLYSGCCSIAPPAE